MREIIGRGSAMKLGYIHGNLPGAIIADQAYRAGKKIEAGMKRQLTSKESLPNPGKPPMAKVKGRVQTMKKQQSKAKYSAKTTTSLKRAIINTLPAKHFNCQTVRAMTHNTIYTNIPTQGITQGTGNTNREGDKIFLEALKIRGTFFTPTTANAYIFRIMVLWTGEEYNTANIATTFQTGIGATEVFLPNSYGSNQTTGLVNSKACTVLLDKTYDINSLVSGVEDCVSFYELVPLKLAYSYQSSGSVHGKLKNLAVICMASVSAGTAGTTNTGNLDYSCDLIFKD